MKKSIFLSSLVIVLIFSGNVVFAQKKKSSTATKTLASNQTVALANSSVPDKKEYVAEQMTDEQALEMVTQQLEAATTTQPAAEEVPQMDENRIYTVVEASAQFPGGVTALNQFLTANIHYPKEAKKDNIAGKVYTKVLIEKDGSVSDVQIIKGLGHGCDEEAVRVIKTTSNWKPARQHENIVRSYYMLQVNFVPAN
ncbi:energy transducer TonB [Cytophagaceae bacterium DM2B3-1]|uniref:Energy transducer TonB n=1 Tax=Xanthocytophaga flava TaxID=3048013 RepID=A0ABT7CSF4_9BACT|nr:energy transducer TonB [Xanthocytophaga flavus]MDJ1471456.1 energy transducer TonB [Xanthocytophaga flavus]MDJ1496696.1 energy transducer TonB [Xanthocytophaga flavus]